MSATPSAEPVNRLLNDPFAAVDEMLDGIVAAFPGTVRRTGGGHCLLSRSRSPSRRICVVTGGGSGHEPAFFGYLGRGLADAAAIGNVFASPSATPVIEGVTEIAAPALFIFGNYDGDVMNFGMAADLLAEDGVPSDTVLVTDDVVSAPRGSEADRRGVAGDLIVIKAAGARADEGASLEEVAAAARYANERTRTAGVGLSACTLPTSRIPSFDLPVGLMDVGIGLHGEAGIRRGPVASADEVVDELLELVMAELPVDGNAGVSVIVNLLGATPYLEGFIVFRAVSQRLRREGVHIRISGVGEYVTSLDMRGISLTVTALDDELQRLLSAPAEPVFAPMLHVHP